MNLQADGEYEVREITKIVYFSGKCNRIIGHGVHWFVPRAVSCRVNISGFYRNAGLQRQRMELFAHAALERLIDKLMLLDARYPLEAG